ncbi:MAG: DUF4389 domain-containing protein [Candidatus Woesearchaeota archaeon]
MVERKEAVVRFFVLIVSGIILWLWKALIQVLAVFHFLVVLFTGKRVKWLAHFCHIWNCQVYTFLKYITFATNKRPFPFEKLALVDDADI